MDIEEARRRLAANPPQGDPTAEPGETLAEKAARLDADLAALPVLDLADFRQWLIDNGGAMRLALDAADLTDAEVEARLAAAHAQARQRPCVCIPQSWHNTCTCGCADDDTACRAAGCCGVLHPRLEADQ